jgi:predicted neuraminidase
MSVEDPSRTGSDPVTTFDPVHGTAVHASLNYAFLNDGEATDGDVVASVSTDGGLTWNVPVQVYSGLGADNDPLQYFNDKEWITTDTNPSSPYYGRIYLTWTRFKSEYGAFKESPIWSSHSDDGGYTWSTAQQISGSNPLCTYQVDGPSGVCDEDQFSVPTVAPDGTVYVSFQNEQNSATWEPHEVFESQYMVVKSTDGGVTWSNPVHIASMEDGSRDYPTNVDGRQTISGYQVRLSNIGNIVASPIDGTLYQVWSDNSNGTHDVSKPITNTDIWMSKSTNGGTTWSSPMLVDGGPTDAWFPWVDVNPVTGQVGVLYNERYPSDPSTYGARLATMPPGGGTPTYQWVNTKPSHPRQSIFFQAKGGGCPNCATFHGDYIRLVYDSTGAANVVWTDMRKRVVLPNKTGYLQFIDYARIP